ncbi:hypothetical protein LQ948_18060 [Jiella sp. MQZ9-1]|uniref:Uncharacterized protein n=1 Tax=Jiella flava TaxID=2816857 RepID=A0A939JVQ9_9HYPH|nr:hypothetical protein [Jiella flava]MBO0664475.1 hypothetical protein [Jiella flava]MCD2473111.1 hypothetical protein [Jiella flava]
METAIRRLIAFVALIALPLPAVAQPYDPGPGISVPGSSMAGQRIGGAPVIKRKGIPNAKIFGDTVEERAYGRPYDNSYLHPKVPRGASGFGEAERAARDGDARLSPDAAEDFARGGPNAIGASGVARGRSLGHRSQTPPHR